MTAPIRIPVDPVDHYEAQQRKAAEIVRKIKEAEAAK